MNNDRNTNCTDVAIKNDKKSMQKHLIYSLICIAIALISFFAISKWATSADTYSRIINTLNELQKKALELTGTATALATGAAAIPGDATTPIANKLADVAGYMVIVYAVIIIEKYLLTITGYIAFKILFPIGCILMATGNFMKAGWKEFIYRIGIKSIILGILLWGLVPTSVWMTNKVNETYAKSYDMDFTLDDTEKLLDDLQLNLLGTLPMNAGLGNASVGVYKDGDEEVEGLFNPIVINLLNSLKEIEAKKTQA